MNDDRPARRPAPRRPAADAPDRPGKRPKSAAPAAKKPRGTLKARKKQTSPAVLLVTVAAGFALLTGMYFLMQWAIGRAGRATELMAYVPADANWVRGVNTAQLLSYPGYKTEVDKHVTPDVRAAADAIAAASGQDAEKFLDYFMIAKVRPTSGATGTMYLMRSKKKMNGPATGAALAGNKPATAGADPAFAFGANGAGILANSTLYFPSETVAVIVPNGGANKPLLDAAAAGKANKGKDSFAKYYETEDTVRVVTRGSVWLLIRATGGQKDYISSTAKVVDKDFPELAAKAADATTFGIWTTPGGGGVILGVAMETADRASARDLVRVMQKGPLGKGDESEPTPQMRGGNVPFAQDKRVFGEFMQYLEFKSDGKCAILRSKIGHPDAVRRMLDLFNNTNMGTNGSNIALTFGPGAPPPEAGLPGGVVIP